MDDEYNFRFYNESLDASRVYMAGQRRGSPMTNRWRTEENQRRDNYPPRRNRNRSPAAPGPGLGRRGEARPAGRGRSERDDYAPRQNRKRDYSPAPRRPPPRRPSFSPARSPRPPPGRSRYPAGSAYTSRESSPARFPKRRRTRSPSPSDWSERSFEDRRNYSRSRSRDRYDPRDIRPSSRRGFSPRRASPPRQGRPGPRGPGPALAPDTDTYIPERRRPDTPPRARQRRSPSPRPRSLTPPYRRRSQTPPRRLPSRPGSPDSPYDSPRSRYRGPPREASPDYPPRRQPYSRTPSVAGDFEQESMEGPFALRGHHGNPNYMPRGRGHRGYYNNSRGAFRGSPVASAPNSSRHGSPYSNASYHGGRGDWNGPQQHFNQQNQNVPAFRQNNFSGAGQSQEEYFRSQQQPNHPPNHPHPNQTHRQYRGARGQGRGGHFPQHGQDRRFSGPDAPAISPPQRGRGGNTQWNSGAKRGGGPTQPATGPNSLRTSPALSQQDPRDIIPPQEDQAPLQAPRGPQADEFARQEYEASLHQHENRQNNRDQSKISFAFKSKPPPQSPVRPPSDLSTKTKSPPTRPALDRIPPTQPRANKFQDKRHYNQNFQQDRRRDDHEQPQRLPPKGPGQQQQHVDRPRPIPTEPRGRSRSPPPKKLKQDLPPPKPTLTPEMAASDSVYFRKPGNESVVGAGTYGKVFKAIHIFTKDKVALKKIRMEGERDGFPITAVREIKLLQNLRHKHVVALQEVMVEKNECFMVFEYMSHDMTGLINHPTFRLTAAHKKDLGRQMFEGLEFLHRRGVMHRDIKAANLLISNNGQLKYADFGLARFYTKSRKLDYTNRVITIWYRPPELLLGETQYGPAVDIWSAACVFMEMFTRKAIFPGEGGELSQLEKIYNVLGTPSKHEWPGIIDMPWYELMQPATSTDGQRKKRVFEQNFGEVLSPAAMDLVTQIFRYDPAQRPDAAEILRHEYFTLEEPAPRQAWELEAVGGDWHEYESKAHRRENDRKEKERRKEEYVREKEKRKAKEAGLDVGSGSGVDGKKMKGELEQDVGGAGAGVDEVPAAPLPVGEEEDLSDGEGSARMSMS